MPKVLFATHYHELNELEERLPRVKNYHITNKEIGNKIIFLRKLAPGGSTHSFGIHVARMAGMPAEVVERAAEILQTLEADGGRLTEGGESRAAGSASRQPATELKQRVKTVQPRMQLQIFDADEYTRKIREELLAMDLNTMTPMDALWKLNELRKIAEKK
jgi:DNA mismatch repair protein MutS